MLKRELLRRQLSELLTSIVFPAPVCGAAPGAWTSSLSIPDERFAPAARSGASRISLGLEVTD